MPVAVIVSLLLRQLLGSRQTQVALAEEKNSKLASAVSPNTSRRSLCMSVGKGIHHSTAQGLPRNRHIPTFV